MVSQPQSTTHSIQQDEEHQRAHHILAGHHHLVDVNASNTSNAVVVDHHYYYDDDDTVDILVPPFHSEERHATLLPATFNLVATIVGGGVLSLPLAFQKCGGVAAATLYMILAAVATDRSLHLLTWAARRSGAATYGEVARRAFGKPAEWCVAGLLAVFLLFVVTAYLVLVRDIWTPLVLRVLVFLFHFGDDDDPDTIDDENNNNKTTANYVLLFFVVVMIPFLVQRDLYALRYNCYIGFASISILCAALCYQAASNIASSSSSEDTEDGSLAGAIESSTTTAATTTTNKTTTFSNLLFAFPIITLSFLSQFNILPIQTSLKQPTRQRMQRVVHGAVLASGTLMYLFGAAGYLCFPNNTQGNILLNLQDDHRFMVMAGRVGCGVTILFAMPLMVLPCRRNLLELLDCYVEWRNNYRPPPAPPASLSSSSFATTAATTETNT